MAYLTAYLARHEPDPYVLDNSDLPVWVQSPISRSMQSTPSNGRSRASKKQPSAANNLLQAPARASPGRERYRALA